MLRRTTLVFVVAIAMIAGPVPSASADVLVRRPSPKQCVGAKLKVGVWYQEYSGGPRGVRVRVVGPGGKTVLKRSVRATTKWRYWRVKAGHRGAYRTIYRQGRHGKADWKQRFRTRVRRC